MGSRSLLFSWQRSLISDSVLPAGHSRQCFPNFSGRSCLIETPKGLSTFPALVCLSSVRWHTCSIASLLDPSSFRSKWISKYLRWLVRSTTAPSNVTAGIGLRCCRECTTVFVPCLDWWEIRCHDTTGMRYPVVVPLLLLPIFFFFI